MQLADYANRYETLRFERTDGVLVMTMHSNGGEVLWNVSEQGHHNELGLAFADIARDLENKVVILTGTGSNFVAERDANEIVTDASLGDMWERMQRESLAMLEGLLAVPVPVICAVNGPALIHSELPVMCDVVLAAEHASFADTTHMPNGMPPGDGTQIIWPILLGPNRGRYFLLSGQHMSAEEALRLGVVAEVLPADALMPRAREFAARLAQFPRKNLRHAKTIMVRYLRHRIRDEIDMGLAVQGLSILLTRVLAGKVALVTGGGQGLGFDMARAFADEGAKLVLTGRVQEKLDAKAAELRALGTEVVAIAGDVGVRATADAAVAATLAAFGRLDVLVNNAQTLNLPIPLMEQDDERIDANIRSGLYGTIYFMQAAYPALAKEGGAVINLGSGQGLVGGWGTASYAAAKEGIRAVSKVTAREWGKDNIRVNTICPGAWSPSMDEWFKDKPEELAELLAQAPLGRFADGYRDIGRLAVFLAGPDCFMTGQTFYIDGGQLMP